MTRYATYTHAVIVREFTETEPGKVKSADQRPAAPEEVKACLKTVEGVKWTMTKEERAAKQGRVKPTVSDPGGLF